MPESPAVIGIYHKDCNDGTTAAAVVLRKFPHAQLFPLSHAYTPADIQPIREAVPVGAKVFLVDCALGINEFLADGHQVTVIDHHIGFYEKMQAIVAEYKGQAGYVFDNNKSGASLCWSYFFPNEEMPELVKYVEDVDLWKWKYGDDSKHVGNYLSMFRNNPAKVREMMDCDLTDIKAKGSVISMYADKEIEELVTLPSLAIKIGEYSVPTYNITNYESASGNILSQQLDQAVAMFTIRGGQVKISFRSKEHQVPTSLQLAQSLGGGGHTCAAGADVPLKDFIGMIVL